MSWGERGVGKDRRNPLYALMILKEHSSNGTTSPFFRFSSPFLPRSWGYPIRTSAYKLTYFSLNSSESG